MIPWLEPDDPFPEPGLASGPDSAFPGLLAAGGSLEPQRLRQAYSRGIFPWFNDGQPILWWSTAPRMVLPVEAFKLSRSLNKTIQRLRRSPGFEVSVDRCFDRVIRACAQTPRQAQAGTWIGQAMIAAYSRWHQLGEVHSFETWIDGELAGGLYGICIGRMFYGESMFAHRPDASKIALAALVCFCRLEGISVIDCQQDTPHLASLGARTWPRDQFETHLRAVTSLHPPHRWSYDDAMWAALDVRAPALPPPVEREP